MPEKYCPLTVKLVSIDIEKCDLRSVACVAYRNLSTNVPSVALYQLEKFVPVMTALSAARVTAAVVVGM